MKKFLLIPTIAAMTIAPLTVLSGCTLHLNPQSEPQELCFEKDGSSGAESTISYFAEGELDIDIESKLNDGEWNDWNGSSKTLKSGDKLYVRNTKNTLASNDGIFEFKIQNGKIKASGNVNSLINNASLSNYCFQGLFRGCWYLTQAPKLPATQMATGCYNDMFNDCTSLKQAPELPATSLAPSCYQAMFSGCSSLTAAPELRADTLASACYWYMFNGCTSLKVNENGIGTKIFTCPSTSGLEEPVDDMFLNTDGSFKGTPKTGQTYNWYTE